MHQAGKYRNGVLKIRLDKRGIHGVIQKERVEQIGKSDQHGGEISEAGKRACKNGKFAFQRAVPFILTKRASHLPVKGVFAHFAYPYRRFAARNQTAFEYLFAAGKPFRAGKRSGRFFDFRAFARERGLRYGKSARKHDAVRGDAFARFQKQYIADDKFAYGDLFCFSAAADAAGQVFALRHQLFERRFAAVFREGGNERG